MSYSTTLTSKGTITIAAPLRKTLGLKPGQKLSLTLNEQNQVVVESGTNLEAFEKMRAKITQRIPNQLMGLSGETLRIAAAKAWSKKGNE